MENDIYEIRVKGHLESPYWAEWLDSVSIANQRDGESILRVRTADQAVLYGVLARLRNLGVALIGVRHIQSLEGQRWRSRLMWGQITLFLLVTSGYTALAVYLAVEHIMHVALSLTLLFSLAAGAAWTLFTYGAGKGWRIVALAGGSSAVITAIIFTAVAGWLHPALVGMLAAFLAAAALAAWMRRWPVQVFGDNEEKLPGGK